jgi:hypothetical protein
MLMFDQGEQNVNAGNRRKSNYEGGHVYEDTKFSFIE